MKQSTSAKPDPLHYVPDNAESRRRQRKWLTIIFILLGILIVIVGGIFLPYLTSTAPATESIRIPHKSDKSQLRDTLYKYYAPGFADKVLAVVGGDDKSEVRPGYFVIEKGMTAWSAGRKLKSGTQTPVTLTFNGFRDFNLLTERIGAKLEISPDRVREVFTDSTRLADLGLTPEQCLAAFPEDSYEVYWTVTPDQLFKKITDHYKEIWNEERRNKASALGLTPAEVITIASIVDEETNAKEEKGTVGRLYVNRLHKGMKLQADPTVRFALNDFTIRRVTRQHLGVESPYNTYKVEGLPPGLIRTTSVATIDAILNSEPNEYLYMCAKEDFSGRHNFAKDYSTHEANARRYQNALNERGIK